MTPVPVGTRLLRVEDITLSEYRWAHGDRGSWRAGRHRRTFTLGERREEPFIEMFQQGLSPGDPARAADEQRVEALVDELVRDPATGRIDPAVLGAEYEEISCTVTARVKDRTLTWDHRRRRLWHWTARAGGGSLEGDVTSGDVYPDAARLARWRQDALAGRAATDRISGSQRVLLRPGVGVHLINLLASAVNGNNVLGGMSALRQRVGKRIAPANVTVADDGGLDGPHGALVDAEGERTRRNVLLDRGVLTGFLHTRATAQALGMDANGTAVQAFPGSRITAGVRAFTVVPTSGEDAGPVLGTGFEAVAATGPASRTADGRSVRLEVVGWEWVGGCRRRPIGPTVLEVGVFGWLRQIAGSHGPVRHSAIFGGVAAPDLVLADVRTWAADE